MIKKIVLGLLVATNIAGVSAQTITVDNKTFADMNKDGKLQPYEDTRLPDNVRIEDLISRLTLEEKTNLVIGTGMAGFDFLESVNPVVGATNYLVPGAAGTTTPLEKYGIPAIVMTDGPAGVRISPTRKEDNKTYYATGFPVGTLVACTWDVKMAELLGKTIGIEGLEYGSNVQLTPAMNIMRNPLCGRNFEYYSEDPVVTGKIAAALVNGMEGVGMATSPKHYAANNNETNRMSINVHVSQRALREIYLRGFEILVKESNPSTIMSSYNKINGTYTSADYHLLTTILRDEWGFKGLVVTDWFGGYSGLATLFSGGAGQSISSLQIQAGNDLIMPGLIPQRDAIIKDIKEGKLKEGVLDLSVRRVLKLVFSSAKMRGYKYTDTPDLEAHAKVARQIASEGMVLLSNNGSALPLDKKIKNIAIFGSVSYNLVAGGTGSGDVHKAYTVSLAEGLQNAGYTIDKNISTVYIPYNTQVLAKVKEEQKKQPFPFAFNLGQPEINKEIIEKSAKTQDIAIITIGRQIGEFFDRKFDGDYNLSEAEQKLIDEVSQIYHTQGKKVVVVLNIGGVIETVSWKDKVDAILLAWQPGQEGGDAITDVLTGKVNPSGKLTMTFPVSYKDIPSSDNFPDTAQKPIPESVSYKEGIYVGYRYFNSFGVKPAYEFGYGLSYTTFDYSNIRLSNTHFENELFVTVDIKNTGKVAGKEVVQLYLSAPQGTIDKPVKELKGFAKTKLLEPDETQTLYFHLTSKDLASFSTKELAWIADEGEYNIEIAASANDTRQNAGFTLLETIVVEKVNNVMNNDADFTDLKP